MNDSARDLRHLPPIFLAYPGQAAMAERMGNLGEEMRQAGAAVKTWQEITNPGFLFDPIADAINRADLVLADTTHGNPNVMFEVGYAIARRKHVLLLRDNNVAKPLEMPPLDLVRRVDYTSRGDIIRFLASVDLTGFPMVEQMGRQQTAHEHAGLYFVPSRRGGDFNDAALAIAREGPFSVKMMDMWDTGFDNLTSQTASIQDADLFVTLLVSKETREYWPNNAEAMLFAGLAAGFDKDFAVLVQQPHRRLVDLGEHTIRFESEAQLGLQVRRWLTRVAAHRLRGPRPPATILRSPRSPLGQLFMGNLDARADFDLSAYFIETPEFNQAEAGHRHLFAGAKGSGKTANFEILNDRLSSRNVVLITIAPADFEFPHLAAVFEEHLSLAHWEFVYGSFWRFILHTEVLRAIQLKFLGHLVRESGDGKRYATGLLSWIDSNEQLLRLDFVSRVNSVLGQIRELTGDDLAKRESLEALLQSSRMYDVDRFLREFSRQFEIRLLIDDLDRNWSPSNDASARLIVTLLNEVHALMTNHRGRLRPAVFLRRDVFKWLELNDPELLKRDPGYLKWTAESLVLLVASRIARQLSTQLTDPEDLWNEVFPKYTRGEPTTEFVINRTLLRPRDVVEFCQQAVESAQRAGRTKVDEDDVYAAWESSGENILIQAHTEYQHTYPGLSDLVLGLSERPAALGWQEFREAMVERATRIARGVGWLTEGQGEPIVLLKALYESGVVGIVTRGGSRWFESSRSFTEIKLSLSDDFQVVIHPAFHRYLGCPDV